MLDTGPSGLTATEWLETFQERLNYTEPAVSYRSAGQSYDAAWTVAYTLNNTARILQSDGIMSASHLYVTS